MEICLSKLLKQIKICDNLDLKSLANIDDDQSIISSASYYNKMLSMVLENLTNKLDASNNTEWLLNETAFSHLQLTIQK